MESSRTSLHKWVIAIQLISRSTNRGLTAVKLQHTIQVTYKTAWSMLHKIRQAMSKADLAKKLTGPVFSKLNFYSRPRFIVRPDYPPKSAVIAAAEIDRSGMPAYLKLKQVPQRHVYHGRINKSISQLFNHLHVRSPMHQDVTPLIPYYQHQPLLEEFENARSWINRTFIAIGAKYLQAYLDEYCFRRNMAKFGRNPIERLLKLCMRTRRLPLRYHQPLTEWNVRPPEWDRPPKMIPYYA